VVRVYLAVILVVCAWPTSASLIALQVGDWRTSGDALVVRDPGNRLEWLRLSVTRGASAQQIEASHYFDPTGRAGFRWASQDELSALFSHLSGHIEPQNLFVPASDEMLRQATEFYVLFGRAPPGPDALFFAGITHGMFRLTDGDFLSAYVIGAAGGGRLHGVVTSLFTSGVAEPLENWNPTLQDPRMGAWLVRNVPEPGTGWLVGAASLLLAGHLRRGCRSAKRA